MLKLRSTNCLVTVVWQDKVEVDRKSLKWDKRMVDERIIVKWGEKYYVGTLTSYDTKTQVHSISWADGDPLSHIDLMKPQKMVKGRKAVSHEWLHLVRTIPLAQFMATPYNVAAKYLGTGGSAAEVGEEESDTDSDYDN